MAFHTRDQYEPPDGYGAYPPNPSRQQPAPPRPWHPPRPSHRPPPAHPPTVPAREDRDLGRLRTAYRRLRRSMTLIVLAYFTVYLCMAAYLPDMLGTAVFGTLNLGVFLGLLLVPLTILVVVGYEFVARSTVDPAAHRVRVADSEQREREERERREREERR